MFRGLSQIRCVGGSLAALALLAPSGGGAASRVGEPVGLERYDSDYPYRPRIAALPDGSFYAVWNDGRYTYWDGWSGVGVGLMGGHLSPSGIPDEPSTLLVPFAGKFPREPQVVAAPDGSIVMVWNDIEGLQIQRFRAGVPVTPALQLVASVEDPSLSHGTPTAFVIDGSGRILVSWLELGGSYYSVLDYLNLETVLPATQISGRFLAAGLPSGFQVVRRSAGGEWFAYCANAEGTISGAVEQFELPDAAFGYGVPFIAAQPDGRGLVAYRTLSGAGEGIRATLIACGPEGASVGENLVVDAGAAFAWHPGVAALPSGGWAIQWARLIDYWEGSFEAALQVVGADGELLGQRLTLMIGLDDEDEEIYQSDGSVASSFNGTIVAVWHAGVAHPHIFAHTAVEGCNQNEYTACLGGGRFSVAVDGHDFSGAPVRGRATGFGSSSADFWFFDESNREIFLKVIDACELTENFWVFWSALSNISYSVVVVDTLTGQRLVYENPSGYVAPSVLDANTDFRWCVGQSEVSASRERFVFTDSLPAPTNPHVVEQESPSGPCLESGSVACLLGGRFRVEGVWRDFHGNSGVANFLAVSEASAYGSFFDENNKEIFVKLVDACALTGNYWVFAAGLTNLEATLRVTDTVFGKVYEQSSPLGENFAPNLDIGTFLSNCN